MYRPLIFAGNISFDFITEGYKVIFGKDFPYPEFLTNENIFRFMDKRLTSNNKRSPLQTMSKEENELLKFMEKAGPIIFEKGTDIYREWADTLSMSSVCDRWKKNKQVLTCTDDFIECLSTAKELSIPEDLVERMPFDTFCLDLTQNEFFEDMDYAYVTFRHTPEGDLQVHIIRIVQDEVFFAVYIVLSEDALTQENGIRFWKYEKKIIPKQDTLSLARDAMHTIGKSEIDNSKFSNMCIFVIQLAMYICSTNREFKENETTKKTYRPERKSQNKFCAVQKWDVGYITGKTFRQKKEAATGKRSEYTLEYKRKSPIPHMRRGHFQLYHIGEGRTETDIKWIDPTFVGGDPENNLPIVHKVK